MSGERHVSERGGVRTPRVARRMPHAACRTPRAARASVARCRLGLFRLSFATLTSDW